jgi:ribose transport system permease protein
MTGAAAWVGLMMMPPWRSRRFWRSMLPAMSLAIVLTAIFIVQPRTMSYFGLNLMLQYAVPIALATLAQMFVITVNDLDLSLGAFVGLVAAIGATWLHDTPLLGVAALFGCMVAYGAMGALIHLRNLPSIVVTLGMSFVWLGLAVLLLPSPGGKAPDFTRAIMGVQTPFIPFPILASIAIAAIVWLALTQSAYGVVLRGAGGNPRAIARAGWSLLTTKVVMFSLAGFFGILSGLALIGLTTSGDAHIADRYTLYSIAGVILGGGQFVGGRVSPTGAVLGALTLALAGAFLTFMRISPDWQIGAQGGILILVLALRAVLDREDAPR